MILYNEKNVPMLFGETQGRTASVMTEEQLRNRIVNQASTVLPVGAVVEFLDKLIAKAQKRNVNDPEGAPTNDFILMSVNGKQRWIGVGTFSRRRFDMDGRPYISEISKDIPEDINLVDFYEKFKDKKFKVVNRVTVHSEQFGDQVYPVLEYVE